ncbi:MAG: STAS domain-containing protein [Pseudonocardiaceae bacterium]
MSTAQDVAFAVETEIADTTATVSVHGEVDIATAPTLWEGLVEAIATSPSRLVIDLTDMGFIDCSGLGVIARTAQRIPAAACRIVLRSPNRLAHMMIEFAGLDGPCLIEPGAPADNTDGRS